MSDDLESQQILINVDGEILGADAAVVSAMDHGFLYGDSAYETLRTYHRRPFLIVPHLERLERSLERIFLEPPRTRAELEREVTRTIAAHGEAHGTQGDVAIRLVVTRGPGPIGLDLSRCLSPRFLIYAFPARIVPEEHIRDGISVVVSHIRRNHPSALDPGIKSGNFLNNILAYRDAREAGAQEAILLSADGHVAEGTTSNIFTVSRGTVVTPGTFGILEGITRAVAIELARADGVEVEERDVQVEELLGADEVFITSSGRGIVPVTLVNRLRIGDGRPGRVTRRLLELYARRVEEECGPAGA